MNIKTILLFYFLIFQNILAINWFVHEQSKLMLQNDFVKNKPDFCGKLNFNQNLFNKKLFTKPKLEDSFDSPGLKVSHDGKYISSISTNSDSQLVLSISEVSKIRLPKKIILNGNRIYKYGWCYDSNYLWYLADKTGDEKYQLYSVNYNSSKITNLILDADSKVDVLKSSSLFPLELLIKINSLNSVWYDIYKINIKTGKLDLVLKNRENYINFIADSNFNICFSEKITVGCGREVYRKRKDCWELFDTISFEDYQNTELLHMSVDGSKLYLKDSRGKNTAELIEVNLLDNSRKILANDHDCKADLSKILINPESLEVEAACFTFEKDRWSYFDSFDNKTKLYFEYLIDKKNCVVEVISRSFSDDIWIISLSTNKELEYYIYEKDKETNIKFIGGSYLQRETLSKIIYSQDGLSLVSYLTLPVEAKYAKEHPYGPSPMILMVHGGPWMRDDYRVAQNHQVFAEEGYAVLSVNFRGSTGFGKYFLNSSIGQWGRGIVDDLIDAAKWAIDQGIADPSKIGICGDSFGGYATLAALAFMPNVFSCGVSFAGISNLETLIQNLPADLTSTTDWFRKMLGGDERSFDGGYFLRSQSPLFFANKIISPLLIGHGGNDPRVKKSESELIFNKMKLDQRVVSYALFPDEGHFLSKPANYNIFQKLTLSFFSKHLKDEEYEISDDDFKNSSIIYKS